MFRQNVRLAPYSNYRIGGEARFFFEGSSTEEIIAAVREAKRRAIPVFVWGGGTNVLVDDGGFSGLVLSPKISMLECNGNIVRVGAGISMNELTAFAAREGLDGLAWAGGLPGTVGGAIRGNAGAFGGEIKDSLVHVTSIDMRHNPPRLVKRGKEECAFAYRSSVFKEQGGQEIILEAGFLLAYGDKKEILMRTDEKIGYRNMKHPLEYPNIGSIFKNVPVSSLPARFVNARTPVKNDPLPVVPVAFLISEAKLRGVSYGGAMISPKHANFIVNAMHASSNDVESLIALIEAKIKKMFSIALEEEIVRMKG